MSKTSIVIIIYILGLIFGALYLNIWSADTNVYEGLLGLGWTALLLIGLSVGCTLGVVSNLFIKGVAEITDLRKSLLPDFIAPSFSPIISLLLAAFLIIIIRKVFNITRWHGPPDAILAAHKSNNSIDIKQGFGSTLTAFISASGGASVGQYGPLVHFGATVATFLENFTSKRLPPGIFIGCGVAAAISAGFNAPIAGLVFAHEAVLRHFSLRAGGAIAISSITASTIGSGIFKETLGLKPKYFIRTLSNNFLGVPSGLVKSYSILPLNPTIFFILFASSLIVISILLPTLT